MLIDEKKLTVIDVFKNRRRKAAQKTRNKFTF